MADGDTSPASTGQLLYDAGWYQGAILPVEVAVRLRPATVPDHYQYAVVVAQDCNVVRDDQETHVEIAFGYCPQANENTNGFARGKNPRCFLTEVGADLRLVWDVRHRLSVYKSDLSTALGAEKPEVRLLDSDLREFRAWLGRRYSRPAFPDTFNERLLPAKTAIDKATKSEGFRSVRAVFYLIVERDEELAAGKPYSFQIIFCFSDNPTAKPLPDTEAQIAKFVNAVTDCRDILLTKHMAISDARFPFQYLDVWECVDFDVRSYGSAESAPPRI